MNTFKKYVCGGIIILYLLSLVGCGVPVNRDMELQEQKRYSSASLEDSFAEDKILVVLSNVESLKFKTYCPEDFSEIGCLDVSDLTEYTTTVAKLKMAGDESYQHNSVSDNGIGILNVQDVDLNSFNRILSITLSDTGKEEVLWAIHALEDRDDVIYVGPNYQHLFFQKRQMIHITMNKMMRWN